MVLIFITSQVDIYIKALYRCNDYILNFKIRNKNLINFKYSNVLLINFKVS